MTAGDQLGPYQLLAPIGEGGMGEVWKARDTRLDRVVAVKVSKQEFTERFEREARAIAALNHPNICQLYDVGPNYLVMEYIEGTQLKGPIPVERAVEYACQILDALDAAHKKGITHRDLKPANILITKQGIKLLDFGLAKQTGPLKQTDATLTKALTAEGQIAGTLQYMAPEQLQAKEADARSDIFAFGCVLYEIISGKKAFAGTSAASVIAAVLEREPAPIQLTPPLDRVIRTCLAKEPEQRFQTATDLKRNLSWALERSATPDIPAKNNARWPLWSAGAVLFAILAAIAGWQLAPKTEIDSSEWKFTPIASESTGSASSRWSKDGKSIVYGGVVNGTSQIFLRRLESPLATQLTFEAHDCRHPFFAPDGTTVYFRVYEPRGEGGRASLWSVSVAGGRPVKLFDVEGFSGTTSLPGAAISPDGKDLVVVERKGGKTALWTSSPPGAPLKLLPVSIPTEATSTVTYLEFSFDGTRLLALATSPRMELWLIPWPAGNGSARLLHAQPAALTNNASASWFPGNRHILLAMPTLSRFDGPLQLFDSETGKSSPLLNGLPEYLNASISPQGRLAFTKLTKDSDIVEIPLDGSPLRTVLSTRRSEELPVWSPVAKEFAYVTNRSGAPEIWLADGTTGKSRPVVTKDQSAGWTSFVNYPPAFSRDGRRIAYGANGTIYTSSIDGGTPVPVLPEGADIRRVAWSPTGEWIAYNNRKTRRIERLNLATREIVPITEASDTPIAYLFWSPDGKWITAQFLEGFGVISPDGKTKKLLRPGPLSGIGACGWSRDGAKLYIAMRENGRMILSEYEIESRRQRQIRDMDQFRFSGFVGSGSLSASADDKSLLTMEFHATSEIWMLEGVRIP